MQQNGLQVKLLSIEMKTSQWRDRVNLAEDRSGKERVEVDRSAALWCFRVYHREMKRQIRRFAIYFSDGRLTLFILLCISACPSAHECVYGRYSRLSICLHSPKRKIATNVGRPAGKHPIPLVAGNLLGRSEYRIHFQVLPYPLA